MNRVAISSFFVIGTALLVAHVGCGSNAGGDGGFEPTGSGTAQGGAGAGHGSSNGGSTFVGSGGTGTNSGGSTSSGINPDAACASSSSKATLVPLNMYIMFDDSGSMADKVPPDPNSKWVDASTALKAFFQDPASAGLRVALRFFPDGDCSKSDDHGHPTCSINACATPQVPLGPLLAAAAPTDTQEAALVAAVAAHDGPPPKLGSGNGGTPLSAALQGAVNFATAYETAHPTEKSVVVLVTDGTPNGCDETPADIAAIAATGVPSGVLTFAVGLAGSNQTQMDQIAMSGGTTASITVGGANSAAELLAAFEKIRGSVVSCAFTLPTKDKNGDPIDPSKVNVDYTPGGNGMETIFPEVSDASKCGNKDGWYYDNPTHPTTITLCPHTCQDVQSDKGAEIDILYGCSSQHVPK